MEYMTKKVEQGDVNAAPLMSKKFRKKKSEFFNLLSLSSQGEANGTPIIPEEATPSSPVLHTPRGFVGDKSDKLALKAPAAALSVDEETASVVVIAAEKAVSGAYMMSQITGTLVPADVAMISEPILASLLIAKLVGRGYSLASQTAISPTEILFTMIRQLSQPSGHERSRRGTSADRGASADGAPPADRERTRRRHRGSTHADASAASKVEVGQAMMAYA